MEDPIRIPIDDDINLLPIPPMDLDFLTSDFNGEIDGGNFIGGVDFDFSFDDLDFADGFLLESPQSVVSNPNFEQNLSHGEFRIYDCENNGLISHGESNFGKKLKLSSPNSPDFGRTGEVRVYDCLNQGLASSEESNSGEKLINSTLNLPNCDGRSPNLVQNRSNGEIKVHDCSNQGSISSEESNFNGKLYSSSWKSLNCDGRSPNSEQIQSSDEIRVYACSKPVQVSSEESSFFDKTNCHSPNSSDLGHTCDRDVSSSLFVDNNNSSVDKLSESSGLKRKIKAEETIGSKNNSLLKRKRDQEQCKSVNFNVGSDEDDKRKVRLMRNRESAQLSRQRKKQYVEELEDKVRSMHATITDLHGRISCVMSENAALRQQLCGGAGAGAATSVVPPPMRNGMHPMGVAPMPYPWMPCPPYMVKPPGSQVPLVPIPRLKPQKPVSSLKVNKKGESKKNEGKTKKVASISLLGLLFFFLLFGGLLPMVNVRYGGSGEGIGVVPKGKVLMVNNHMDRVGCKGNTGTKDENLRHGRSLQQLNMSDGFGPPLGYCSEPLTASLYVPRNDKLVKIDGNLIIHSVLASERTVASHIEPGVKTGEETSLAVVRQHPPYPVPRPGKNDGRCPGINGNSNGRQRAIGSSFPDQSKPVASDGKLQQWFHEGLTGPMLSSGMCTEVFQFNISPTPGSIVPATFISNTTSQNRQNSTQLKGKLRNRRILKGHSIPLDGKAFNTTEENMLPHKQHDGLKNNTESSIIVSVLVDPREVGDGDGEGVIRSKTLSRIFVVVLIDSVKYVTYSCMLPFVGPGNHLVTT